MGYGAMITLHGAMVLHYAENCNKVMAPYDHGVLAYGAMQYKHGALGLGAVQKGSDREIFIDPVHFVFKFQKKVNLSHFEYILAQTLTSYPPFLSLDQLDPPPLVRTPGELLFARGSS
jgi:hypothetical protein